MNPHTLKHIHESTEAIYKDKEHDALYRLFPPHLRLWGYVFNSTSIDPNLMPLGSV